MDSETFYRNVFLLTQVVPPTKDFLKHFKEGMFDKPNTVGSQHVTHYLLTIYDCERFKKHVQWPLYCKKSEAKYRTDVKDFLTLVAHENPDIDFPQILVSHLLHASGSKFNSIMANLSTVVLRTWLKQETATMLLVPKSGVTQGLSRTMLRNLISRNMEILEEGNRNMIKNETEAKEFANATADSIRKCQDELFVTRQNLIKISSEAPVHPDVKKRLADPDDIEVLSMWESSYNDSVEFLKKKQNRLREIVELSNNVASMIRSIVSTDMNTLDGERLLKIDTKELSEIDELSPETQVMLYRLYENETLVLENFLSLFNLFLMDYQRFIKKHGFPDFSGCKSHILTSCEDVKLMNNIFHDVHDRIVEITSHLKNRSNREVYSSTNLTPCKMDHNFFDSELLKSSPIININWNPEFDGNEFRERLELTPVENVHRALFSRHKKNDDVTTYNLKLRPKLLIPRINFDGMRSSSVSEKLSPINRNVTLKMIGQRNSSRDGKYSRIFSTCTKRTVNRLNCSVQSVSNLSRINSIADMNSMYNAYNLSELRSHLVATSKYTENVKIYSPEKFTQMTDNANRASSTMNEDEKTASMIELSKPMDDIKGEIKMKMGQSSKIREFTERPKSTKKSQNRRLSISDLVERYKKICDNSVDVTIRMNFSDMSDECENDS